MTTSPGRAAASPDPGPDRRAGPPVALVTGGTRGIGGAIARRLVAAGFSLTVVGRRQGGVDAMVGELGGGGAEVHGVAVDLADADRNDVLIREHEARFGRLDLLVLGAGAGSEAAIADLPAKAVDLQLDLNLRSPILLVRGFLPLLRATAAAHPASGARVVALASLTALAAEPMLSVYGAAKAGLISFCEALSTEESSSGVSATALAPGYVATDMTAHLHDRIRPEDMIPAGDVAELVVALSRLSAATVVPTVAMSRAGREVWRV
jgi:3-oxoacyl-[acyl-carrier protein] reductase